MPDRLRLEDADEVGAPVAGQPRVRPQVAGAAKLAQGCQGQANRQACFPGVVHGLASPVETARQAPEAVVRGGVPVVEANGDARQAGLRQCLRAFSAEPVAGSVDPKVGLPGVAFPQDAQQLVEAVERLAAAELEGSQAAGLQFADDIQDGLRRQGFAAVERIPFETMGALQRAFFGHGQKNFVQPGRPAGQGQPAQELAFGQAARRRTIDPGKRNLGEHPLAHANGFGQMAQLCIFAVNADLAPHCAPGVAPAGVQLQGNLRQPGQQAQFEQPEPPAREQGRAGRLFDGWMVVHVVGC